MIKILIIKWLDVSHIQNPMNFDMDTGWLIAFWTPLTKTNKAALL